MKLKQIFSKYSYRGNAGVSHLKFCPCCGSQVKFKNDGDRLRPTCPQCDFIHYSNPSTAVSVLISSADRVLLGKRAGWNFQGDKWCLPCGFIEFDEDFITAGCREVREETGLEVQIDAIINVTHNFFTPHLHTLVVVLSARMIGGELTPNDDIVALKWFGLEDSLPDLAFESDHDIILRYWENALDCIPVGH